MKRMDQHIKIPANVDRLRVENTKNYFWMR